VAATLATVLAAIYILWMYQRTMTGPVKEQTRHMPDLKARELWAVGPLIALIIFFGFYPQPLLNIINPAVHRTLVQTHSTDPVPPHPAKVVVHVGKSAHGAQAARGAEAARGTQAASGSLTKKGLAP
jgi:NADH:ubiquinone oxidoreductase subunit 5 (subunit L)/multisubunit Na+/H+ antiporter MnhA subunit